MPRNYFTSKFNVMYGAESGGAMFGTMGDDLMIGRGGNDFMLGGFGNDFMYGGDGNDYMHGGDGDDVVIGGPGNDLLFGGNGNDRLVISDGDVASGGAGADMFQFDTRKGGTVQISDFDAAEGDILMLRTRSDDDWKLEENANHTSIHFESGAVVELYGVSIEQIQDDPGLFGL